MKRGDLDEQEKEKKTFKTSNGWEFKGIFPINLRAEERNRKVIFFIFSIFHFYRFMSIMMYNT
jgi:hypothetical protein